MQKILALTIFRRLKAMAVAVKKIHTSDILGNSIHAGPAFLGYVSQLPFLLCFYYLFFHPIIKKYETEG
jgi:hypothetical protein